MKKFIFASVIILVCVTVSASLYAEVQNIKVGGDISLLSFYRNGFDSTPSLNVGDQQFLSSIAHFYIEADLTDNVMAGIQFVNERDWGRDSTVSTDVDIDLAYFTIKEFFYSPLTVTFGRQEIVFGDEFVIGSVLTYPSNLAAVDYSTPIGFDAVRATLDYSPWTIDFVYAKTSNNNTTTASDDTDLGGTNIGYKFDVYNAEAEGYYWMQRIGGEATTSEEVHTNTFGLRGSFQPFSGLLLKGEAGWQYGDISEDSRIEDRNAFAIDVSGAYTWTESTWKPTLGARYAWISHEWNPLYNNQVNGGIYDEALCTGTRNGGASSNVRFINATGSITPIESLTLTGEYYHYTLDRHYNGGTSPAGFTMTSSRDAGNEIDLTLEYAYTEDVTFTLENDYFIPGNAFAEANEGTASQIVGSVAVTF